MFDFPHALSGRYPPVPRDLSVPLSLTRSGLPVIIPSFSQEGDQLIPFSLSVFSLILLSQKVGSVRATFSSLFYGHPPDDMDSVQGMVSDLKFRLSDLISIDLGSGLFLFYRSDLVEPSPFLFGLAHPW